MVSLFPHIRVPMGSQMNSPLPDRLETGRLLLRKPVETDAQILYDTYTQDADVARFMVWRPHDNVEQTEAFIWSCILDWDRGERRSYILELRGGLSGAIGMLAASWVGHTVDVGYVLARKYWGRGLMPEALTSLAEILLKGPDVFRVQATCDIDNLASARTLEKAGFVQEGHLSRFTVHPNVSVQPRPCLMYAKCR
jgi:[ribosomal protein S5]-alanine N-acetyltransferase